MLSWIYDPCGGIKLCANEVFYKQYVQLTLIVCIMKFSSLYSFIEALLYILLNFCLDLLPQGGGVQMLRWR